MTNLRQRSTFGAAIPGGFSFRSVQIRLESRGESFGISFQSLRSKDSIDLDKAAALLDCAFRIERDAGWKARDQGSRGTCNAFAIVAAEELSHAFEEESPKLVTFSEERLYRAMRYAPFPPHVSESPESQDKIARDGSTFLWQGKAALEAGKLQEGDPDAYRNDPNVPVNFTVPEQRDNRLNAAAPVRSYDHGLDTGFGSGGGVGQLNQLGNAPRGGSIDYSTRFLEALSAGIPVVASFPVLANHGDSTWYGHRARLHGQVRFPPLEIARNLPFVGGHTVCIVGALFGGRFGRGSFIIRNSFGQDAFGGSPSLQAGDGPILPRGFGYISAEDVDNYCWEYLHRSIPFQFPA